MEEFEWNTAVHEAAHAVVGLKLGWDIDWVSAAPSITHYNRTGNETPFQSMTMAAAGCLAERISAGSPWETAFDDALRVFYERLGDEAVDSRLAMGFYATSPAEDLQNLAYAIEAYETREEGIDRFKEARSNAASLLANTWQLVERLGRALQADPSGQSDAVAALLAEARRASD